jgi:hypothetical protein
MSSPRQHIPVWKRLLLALGILFIIIISMIGYSLYQMVHTKIPESYDAWTTGTLVVGYLETHTNQWPKSWDELQSATNVNRPMSVFVPIDRLRQSVKIDWLVDVGHLQQVARSDPNATVHVITRLDGSPLQAVWGADTEPNAKIMSYLKAKLTTTKADAPNADDVAVPNQTPPVPGR